MEIWPEQIWVVVGAILGGVIGGGAQILASWLQWKREEKVARRSERTKNLYVLQDEISKMQSFVYAKIAVKTNPMKPAKGIPNLDDDELMQMDSLPRRLQDISVRIGDLPITRFGSELTRHLVQAKDQGSLSIRQEHLLSAKYSLLSLQVRTIQLLHTDTETDTGDYGKWPFSKWRIRQNNRHIGRIRSEVESVKSKDDEAYQRRLDALAGRPTSPKSDDQTGK